MKKMMLALAMLVMSAGAFAAEIKMMDTSAKTRTTLSSTPWSLSAVGTLVLFKNTSSAVVSVLYSVDYDSDSVVVRCPLNDTVVQRNNSYICWIPPGEVARVQLTTLGHGASGTFTMLV